MKSIENPDTVPCGVLFSQGNVDVAFLAAAYQTLGISSSNSEPLPKSAKKIVWCVRISVNRKANGR